MSSGAVCVACKHSIDASARLCPYCGANPATGEKIDTAAIMQEVFKPKQMTTSQSVLEYARHRQGIVIFGGLALAFLILAGLHQYATLRNNTAVSNGPAVPLSDVADLSGQPQENQQLPMPPLQLPHRAAPCLLIKTLSSSFKLAPQPEQVLVSGNKPARRSNQISK